MGRQRRWGAATRYFTPTTAARKITGGRRRWGLQPHMPDKSTHKTIVARGEWNRDSCNHVQLPMA